MSYEKGVRWPSRHRFWQMDVVLLSQDCNLESIKAQIKAPYVDIHRMALGGIPSIFIHVSADPKEEWVNGIFHNSRYGIFAVQEDMKLSMNSHHHNTPKLRKSKIKGIEDIAEKINRWVKSVETM